MVDPQQWNRYAYARNNPLKFVDPDGKEIAVKVGNRFVGVGLETVAPTGGNGNREFAILLGLGASVGVVAEIGPLVGLLGRTAYHLAFGCAASASCSSSVTRVAETVVAGPSQSRMAPLRPSIAQIAAAQRMLATDGRQSVERSIRTLELRVTEHLAKIADAQAKGGYTSAMEREIRGFLRQIEAAKKVLEP